MKTLLTGSAVSPSFRLFRSILTIPEHAWGRRVLALAHVYDGPAEEGERVVQPLRSFGEPLVYFSGRMPYRTLQSIYDELFPKAGTVATVNQLTSRASMMM